MPKPSAQPGHPAPTFSLNSVEGTPRALPDLHANGPLLLVFLRHLG
ncbi:MAG: hypothetical protein HUU38_00555 [Anaerolineales bacterium]|nr:hypothetical protein [Anaerolineales bacterium]